MPSNIGQGRGSPWTSWQFITGLTYRHSSIHTHIHTYRQFRVTCQPACLWTVGGSCSTWREPMQTRGEHENSTQRGPTPAGYQTQDLLALRQQCLYLLTSSTVLPLEIFLQITKHNNYVSCSYLELGVVYLCCICLHHSLNPQQKGDFRL